MADEDAWAGRVRRLVDRLSQLSLATILVVAVGVRLAAGLALPAGSTDTYEFGHIAERVAAGDGYAYFPADRDAPLPLERADDATRWLPSSYMPPLYTATVIGARLAVGDSTVELVWAVRAVNLLLSCAGIMGVFALTRRLIGAPRAATLAALGFAVYPPLIYAATQVSAANLYVPLETAALVALLAAARRPSWRPWLVAAVVMGSLTLVRAEAMLLIPVVAGWLWWASRRRPVDGDAVVAAAVDPAAAGTGPEGAPLQTATVPARTRARLAAGFLVVAALLPGAWLVRSSVALGEPATTIATSGGVNLWIGNHAGASGSQKSFDIPDDIRDEIAALPASDDFELRAEAIYRREAIASITGDPLGTVARDVKKLGLLLGADIYDERSLNPASVGAWMALAVFGVLGLVDWWRRADQPSRVLIAGFLALNTAIPVVFFALARYRLPIEVLLLTFAGAWLAARLEASSAVAARDPGGQRAGASAFAPAPAPVEEVLVRSPAG